MRFERAGDANPRLLLMALTDSLDTAFLNTSAYTYIYLTLVMLIFTYVYT